MDDLKISHPNPYKPLDAGEVVNTTTALERRILDLEKLVLALAGGDRTQQLTQVPISDEVDNYTFVYYNPSTRRYEPAVSMSTLTPSGITPSQQSICCGMIINVSYKKGDLVYSGVLTRVAERTNLLDTSFLESGTTFQPGRRLFLSESQPGKATYNQTSLEISVGRTGADELFVDLNEQPPQIRPTTQTFDVAMRPAGDIRDFGDGTDRRRVVAYDGIEVYHAGAKKTFRSTRDSSDAYIRGNGWLKADITFVSGARSDFRRVVVFHLPKDSDDVKYWVLDDIVHFDPNSKESDTFSRKGRSVTHTSFEIKDNRGEYQATMHVGLISEDNSVDRYTVLDIPESFRGWRYVLDSLGGHRYDLYWRSDSENMTVPFIEGDNYTNFQAFESLGIVIDDGNPPTLMPVATGTVYYNNSVNYDKFWRWDSRNKDTLELGNYNHADIELPFNGLREHQTYIKGLSDIYPEHMTEQGSIIPINPVFEKYQPIGDRRYIMLKLYSGEGNTTSFSHYNPKLLTDDVREKATCVFKLKDFDSSNWNPGDAPKIAEGVELRMEDIREYKEPGISGTHYYLILSYGYNPISEVGAKLEDTSVFNYMNNVVTALMEEDNVEYHVTLPDRGSDVWFSPQSSAADGTTDDPLIWSVLRTEETLLDSYRGSFVSVVDQYHNDETLKFLDFADLNDPELSEISPTMESKVKVWGVINNHYIVLNKHVPLFEAEVDKAPAYFNILTAPDYYYNMPADIPLKSKWPIYDVENTMFVLDGRNVPTTVVDNSNDPFTIVDRHAYVAYSVSTIFWIRRTVRRNPWKSENHAHLLKYDDDSPVTNSEYQTLKITLNAGDELRSPIGYLWERTAKPYDDLSYANITSMFVSRKAGAGYVRSLTVSKPLRLTQSGYSGKYLSTSMTGHLELTLENTSGIVGYCDISVDEPAGISRVIFSNRKSSPVIITGVYVVSTDVFGTVASDPFISVGTQEGSLSVQTKDKGLADLNIPYGNIVPPTLVPLRNINRYAVLPVSRYDRDIMFAASMPLIEPGVSVSVAIAKSAVIKIGGNRPGKLVYRVYAIGHSID